MADLVSNLKRLSQAIAPALLLVVALLAALPARAADLTFNRAYLGGLSGQTFTTTTLLNADVGSIRFADGGTQRSFQNTSGTLHYKVGGVPFAETGVLNSRYPNGNTLMDAVAFSGTGGDRLLVLGGAYTTSGAYGGSSNAIVAKLNEYVEATAPDPAQTTLLVNGGSSASVSVGATATIVVTAKLASGSALSGAIVTVSGNPGGGSSISPASATTNASGQASFTVQGLQSGTVTYSATASANGTITTSAGTVSVTYVGVRSAAQSTASAPAGVVGVATTVVVTVRDTGGTVVTGAASGLAASIGGANANAAVSAITDNGNGTYSFTYTPASAGVDSIAITLDGVAISGSPYSSTVSAPALAITTASLPTPAIGVAYSQTVSTSGGTGPVSFSVSAGTLPAGLSLNASTGGIGGTATTPGAYSFTITATDANGVTATQVYSGTIGAGLSITTASLPTPVIGVAYSQTVSTSGGTGPVSFSVSAGTLPAGLSLNASTGVIGGTATTPGAYSFTITATDNNSITATEAYSGTIGSGLAITTTTLPTPAIGVAYSQTVSTSGGTAPVAFSVSAGALPAGLSLAVSTGVISGAATTPGVYSFTITATDNNGVTASQAYSGTVDAGLSITTATLPTPVIGVAYSQTVATSGGIAPISFSVSAGSLPAGLSLAASTGVISGTATTPGAYSFTITATDGNGITAFHAYSGTIGARLAITTTTLATPVIGVAYSQAVATSSGAAPVTFSVSAGSLPAGLSINASTGAISGAATTSGPYSFTITATDNNGVADARSYSGTIGERVSISSGDLTTPLVGESVSVAVFASGGTGPYAFAVSGGALPDGLSFSPTGQISGTPTTAGPFSITIEVTDANGQKASITLSGTVGQVLVANDQSVEVAYNGSVSIALASLGADDVIALQSGVSNGKLDVSGATATYVPAQGYIGSDGFSFSVKRGGGVSRVATVKIKVLPPPPPTAESPSDQTLDTTAEDDAAVVVDQVSFDLTSLVKGLVTDVRIETLPKHGKVEMVRAAAAPAAAATGERQPKAASAAPVPAFTAVYTADKGYVGRDSFTFVAIGPGGVSSPALVNIEVVKSKPSAPVLKVSSLGGRKVVIDLTAAALDGPFIGAALVSKPSESIGAAQLVESGTASDRRYSLEFTSKGVTTGEVRFTYTLTNSSGVSDPLTVILTIEARPDPTLDTGVRAISDAQSEAARRFASTQMDNFSRRLERLHGDQRAGGLAVTLGSGVAGSNACPPTARTPEEQRLCRDGGVAGGSAAGSQGPRGLGEIEVWSGGAITVGRRDPDSGRAKLSVQTSGVSGGADMRVSPALTVGLGGGYASDVSKLGQG
jgi:large repetitive protein